MLDLAGPNDHGRSSDSADPATEVRGGVGNDLDLTDWLHPKAFGLPADGS